MDIIIIISLIIFVSAFVIFKMGDYFSPWMVTTVIWLAIMVMSLFQQDILYPLENQFRICLCIWVPIFCFSSILTYYAITPPDDSQINKSLYKINVNKVIFNVLFVVSLLLTPVYLHRILQIVMMFDTEDLLYNLRLFAVFGDNGLGALNYVYGLNTTLFVVAIWYFPRIPLWKLLLIIASCLMCQFATMEKSGLFFMILTTLFVLFEKRIIKPRTIIISICCVVLIFFFFNMAKEIQSDEKFESMTFVDFFAIYILSPSVAFGRITEDLSTQFGANTFSFVYVYLERFGFGNYELNERLQEFVWVPLPTNVYTIFQPFFEDFGYVGVAFFAFIYGTFSALIYRMFINGNSFGMCMYAYVVRVLVLQFYHEDLLTNFVLFIQFTFFVIILTQNSIVLNYKR